jgi:hypothetical protein
MLNEMGKIQETVQELSKEKNPKKTQNMGFDKKELN